MDWLVFYMLATFAACGLGLLAGRKRPVFACSVLILVIWIMCRASDLLWSEPWSLAPNPLFDTIGALVCYDLYRARGLWWLRALSVLFLAQLALATTFWLLWAFALNPEQHDAAILNYKIGNNGVNSLQLLIVGGVGGWYVMDRIVAYLSRFPGLRFGHALPIRRAGDPPAPTRR